MRENFELRDFEFRICWIWKDEPGRAAFRAPTNSKAEIAQFEILWFSGLRFVVGFFAVQYSLAGCE